MAGAERLAGSQRCAGFVLRDVGGLLAPGVGQQQARARCFERHAQPDEGGQRHLEMGPGVTWARVPCPALQPRRSSLGDHASLRAPQVGQVSRHLDRRVGAVLGELRLAKQLPQLEALEALGTELGQAAAQRRLGGGRSSTAKVDPGVHDDRGRLVLEADDEPLGLLESPLVQPQTGQGGQRLVVERGQGIPGGLECGGELLLGLDPVADGDRIAA